MHIEFHKYQGTGNDFIILDNRDRRYDHLLNEQIRKMCDRKFGIGADGLMLLGNQEGYDFSMRYHNADGKEGSMCGNGGRCLVQFAYDKGIEKENYLFIAVDGEHEATITSDGMVSLKMQDVSGIKDHKGDKILNTGSPHYIKYTDDVDHVDVFNEGVRIRYSTEFDKEGINVNFVEKIGKVLHVRTYERGVEDETLSCGTGVTAAALALSSEDGWQDTTIKVKGGELLVSFNRIDPQHFEDIWLTGPAGFVFSGVYNTNKH